MARPAIAPMNREMKAGRGQQTSPLTAFSVDNKISWYRSPIDREILTQLMQRNNLYGWLQTLAHLGLFFVTAALCYWVFLNISLATWYWTIPVLLLALFLHGTMGPFMGLIAIHELQHRTVFTSKKLNEFFEILYAFISWSDYIWYRESHAIHHQATCHVAYDGEVQLPIRFSIRKWRVWLGLLAWNPKNTWARIKTVVRHARGDIRGSWYNHVLPASNERLRRRHRNWHRILLVGHGSLALLFIATGNWFLIVVFTIGTQYCGWLGFLCGLPQHYGLNSNIPDFRMNTRTFTCSFLPAFYYWNMQYHLEHHMYPAVPFYNLPKLREVIEDDLPRAPHGLVDTWKEMLALRKKFLSDPDFVYMPPLPQANTATVS